MKKYYLGLDIGTSSVGYAVTDENYALMKFKGEPMWGATTFDEAELAVDRRKVRTARRRLVRRQQRVRLLQELFAQEIAKVDSHFFHRLASARLWRDDAEEAHTLFNDIGYTDKDYHKAYPTIHHLILDLMRSSEPHDVRLVFLACAWLAAHRGHFLFDVDSDSAMDLLNAEHVFSRFQEWLDVRGYPHLWNDSVSFQDVLSVLSGRIGVANKKTQYVEKLLGGRKPSKEIGEDDRFSLEKAVQLLCGAQVKLSELFGQAEYSDKKVSLADVAEFENTVLELGEDGDFLAELRNIYDCALLVSAQNGCEYISEAKVEVYEQHGRDLKWLKNFIKKYAPDQYSEVFSTVRKDLNNYAAYACKVNHSDNDKPKRASKNGFLEYLKKTLENMAGAVKNADRQGYVSVMERIGANDFLPRQKDTDNRVIPQQSYRLELKRILDNAKIYLPFLTEKDEAGRSVDEKILAIFDHRIPYFVGPLNAASPRSWAVRKAPGKILPWNFSEKIDLDRSEQEFIRRMTNSCTYLPEESVLPKNSILYSEFTVLNELAPLKVDDAPIPPACRNSMFQELFMKRARIRRVDIEKWLISHGLARKNSRITGIDITIKSSMRPYIAFSRLLDAGLLTRSDAEAIITRMAYTEDRGRLRRWLKRNYPALSDDDIRYIANLGYKGFGSFSRRFLEGIRGICRETGEEMTIMQGLRETGDNLMGLLSSKYTFKKEIDSIEEKYWAEKHLTLEERMDQLRLSGAVKRSVFRTLAIVSDVEKAMGCPPTRIFIEMARGDQPDLKGKRTRSRKEQLLELYKNFDADDTVRKALDGVDDSSLQRDKLFLYFLQNGQCAYTGTNLELDKLNENVYDIDHIWPQSVVKDDSIINNKVLVKSEVNGHKGSTYPLDKNIREKMHGLWTRLRQHGLMSDEKFRRLTRSTPFTEDEKWSFINRQLVETRQSSKAVGTLLSEKFRGRVQIVPVKAGLVSDFRHQFNMLKCRSVNDFHHAKDAYLNIVVGNVWNMKFSRRIFSVSGIYSIKTQKVFEDAVAQASWDGSKSVAFVRRVMETNSVRLTSMPICRKKGKSGGFYDQNPLPAKKSDALMPIKTSLPVEKYGGFDNATTAFFLLVSFYQKGRHDAVFMPVELIDAAGVLKSRENAMRYAERRLPSLAGNGVIERLDFPLGLRPVKIDSVLSLDNVRLTVRGKSSGGKMIVVQLLTPLVLGKDPDDPDKTDFYEYARVLERIAAKIKGNPKITVDSNRDKVTKENNEKLYAIIQKKLQNKPFSLCPGSKSIADILDKGKEAFSKLRDIEQIAVLNSLIAWFGKAANCNLTMIGGNLSGTKRIPARLSNMAKNYSDIRLLDMSAAGLFVRDSGNLIDLL
ncbi:MAG: type II CRISPR RNA-guided endonuclease Cas9 [Desulfovibrionaceae bacterium]|nr:type II CRISPR RNA-guided endonuclease Cas9 [Desulfovibrionaceae bacterium]